jgi:hypothetical protein
VNASQRVCGCQCGRRDCGPVTRGPGPGGEELTPRVLSGTRLLPRFTWTPLTWSSPSAFQWNSSQPLQRSLNCSRRYNSPACPRDRYGSSLHPSARVRAAAHTRYNAQHVRRSLRCPALRSHRLGCRTGVARVVPGPGQGHWLHRRCVVLLRARGRTRLRPMLLVHDPTICKDGSGKYFLFGASRFRCG